MAAVSLAPYPPHSVHVCGSCKGCNSDGVYGASALMCVWWCVWYCAMMVLLFVLVCSVVLGVVVL